MAREGRPWFDYVPLACAVYAGVLPSACQRSGKDFCYTARLCDETEKGGVPLGSPLATKLKGALQDLPLGRMDRIKMTFQPQKQGFLSRHFPFKENFPKWLSRFNGVSTQTWGHQPSSSEHKRGHHLLLRELARLHPESPCGKRSGRLPGSPFKVSAESSARAGGSHGDHWPDPLAKKPEPGGARLFVQGSPRFPWQVVLNITFWPHEW